MAEFQKVMADAKRMCKDYKNCEDCALFKKDFCKYSLLINLDDCGNPEKIKTIETIVEQWAEEHPVKTNRDALKEVFPNYSDFSPCDLDRGVPCQNDCFICRDQWLDEEYKGGAK